MSEVSVTGRSAGDVQRAIDSLPSGGVVRLPAGRYEFDTTVQLANDITLIGEGADETRIVAAPGAHCHMFTNKNPGWGNRNIELRGISLDGGRARGDMPPDVHGVALPCGMLFNNVRGVTIADVEVVDVHRSALRFTRCKGVEVSRFDARRLGWGGMSTSGTDNFSARNVRIRDAGLESKHSGIHVDGGRGIDIDARVESCAGNAVMLDSTYAPLTAAIVNAIGQRSENGLALIGSGGHALTDVTISGDFSHNSRAGIFASNAAHIFVYDATIACNGAYGVLTRGRSQHIILARCRITGSPEEISPLPSGDDSDAEPRGTIVVLNTESTARPRQREQLRRRLARFRHIRRA